MLLELLNGWGIGITNAILNGQVIPISWGCLGTLNIVISNHEAIIHTVDKQLLKVIIVYTNEGFFQVNDWQPSDIGGDEI
jgi:hypothetical protein